MSTADITDKKLASTPGVVNSSTAGYDINAHSIASAVELPGHRSGFTRTDSEATTPRVPSCSELELSQDPLSYAVSLPDAESSTLPVIPSYPPAVLTSTVIVEREETRNLRRFRMFAGFCALFLAGWK